MESRGALKRFLERSAVAAAILSVTAACGGDGGGEEPIHPPSMSNLKYSPAAALQAPGGKAAISGTFDFTDAGGDIASLRIVSSGGVDLSIATPALSGITSGTGSGSFVVSVERIGNDTFGLWVVDGRGNASTRLAGTFEVRPDHTGTTWTRLEVVPPALLYGVTWNGSQYVAVGARGTVMTSTDRARWTVRTAGASRYVAVSTTYRETSTDGRAWTVLPSPDCGNGVLWDGVRYVSAGASICRSPCSGR